MEVAEKEDIYRPPEFLVFSHEEEKVLAYWQNKNIFQKCQQLSTNKPRYTFYDGPPFATGLPHYGHLLAGTIKDIVTRHFYQRGYHVERRFGWDCHGLPVEYEVDKLLNIQSPEDISKIGIDAYNNKCREIVMRYLDEWKNTVGRLGRWVDFDNDYKTLYPWYMESVWWVFKQLYEKGLVYQGVKVMPYSTACSTPLSNFESGQNYKEVVDPCVIVELKIFESFEDTYFLIWTTTPWTLPSNLAICVNPDTTYVRVKSLETKKYYIVAKKRLKFLFKNEVQYKVLESFKGMYLKGLKYKPPFNYFENEVDKTKAFHVLVDKYVTDDSGTGIVHQAPYFGDDDYRVCLAAGVITKSSEIICPVDECGRFTNKVPDFCGQYVKDCDKDIIEKLKNEDCVFQVSMVKHSYPFCWRSDTPLIYKAVPSWFIRVEQITSQLLDCNTQTYWVPNYVKTKRFSNWLKDARDWAVSRNRYWGTPVPIWMSSDGDEIVCIGSISELEKLSGSKVTDLHREFVDKIEIPSAIEGRLPLKRVSEVFDCWFESGSMPYAQQHYPFENEKEFKKLFPADFIAEGIDQTRGWFYTLLVISTALFNKPPFKNLIANGLILAADGQKMSKRKQNYPNPMEIIKKYGADALRLYLINSPVVRAEVLKFQEENIRSIIRNVLSPLNNSYRFLIQNIYRLKEGVGVEYMFEYDKYIAEVNNLTVMDTWILSYKESLLKFVTEEMNEYRLYTVVPNIIKFIEQLTNWYIRLNRKRIKGECDYNECIQSINTLYYVLFTITIIISPFIPFLSEYIYQRLCFFNKNADNVLSVHSEMLPTFTKSFIKIDVERSIVRMQNIIEIGRLLRDQIGSPKKYPVCEVIVIQKDIEKLKNLNIYIKEELNTKKLTMTSNRTQYNIKIKLEPDYKILGQRLKKNLKTVVNEIKLLSEFALHKFLNEETIEIKGHTLKLSEFKIIYSVPEDLSKKYVARGNNDVLVLVDTTPSAEFEQEGIAKEIISKIQKLKKKANLIPTDKVCVYYTITETTNKISNICKKYQKLIEKTIKSPFKKNQIKPNVKSDIKDVFTIKDAQMEVKICNLQPTIHPAVNWTNLILDESLPLRYTKRGRYASVLLQKPNRHYLTMEELKLEISNIFGLYGIPFSLDCGGEELKDVLSAHEQTLIVCRKIEKFVDIFTSKMPFSKFYNYEYDDNQIFTAFFENPKSIQSGVSLC